MKKRSFRVALAALAAVAQAACSSVGANGGLAPRTPLEEGRWIAETHCAMCHAIGAAGRSRHPEAPEFRRLGERYPVSALEEAFAEGILVGHPDMPEFRMSPTQIEAIVTYLQSIQERRGA